MNLQSFKEKLLEKDPSFRKEYFNKEDLVYEISEMVIDARVRRGLSQKQLADLIGTQQPSIARIESGTRVQDLTILQKIASAVGARLLPPKFIYDEVKTKDTVIIAEYSQVESHFYFASHSLKKKECKKEVQYQLDSQVI